MVLSLRVEGLRFAYAGGPALLEDVSFDLGAGDVLCLLGPNGSGKTTLLRCVLGLQRVDAGTIALGGRDLAGLGAAQIAREMAYVPQSAPAVFPFAAFDVVLMGRSPHLRFMASPTALDHQRAREAMVRLDIAHLATRCFHELSGGERQLVLTARALAQGSPLLVMDEPCDGLDVGNQVRVLRIIRDLAAQGYGVLLSSHRPDHAFAVGGQVALLKDGRLRGPGAPEALLDAAALGELYDTAMDVIRVETGPAAGQTLCVPVLRDEPVPARRGAFER